MNIARCVLATALAVALGGAAKAQIAILQIQVVEGEGAVHAPGSRAARFLTVAITDETGKPVEGAAVSFHLPEDGPSGAFGNALRTEVAISDSRGRATAPAFTFNRVPGRFQMRIIAAKEQVRAGIVSFQFISEPAGGASPAAATGPHHSAHWTVIAALLGGGAAAGLLAAHSGRTASTAAAPGPSAPTPPPQLSIGTPTISIGHP